MPELVPPMQAASGPMPTGSGWAVEFAWDGLRTVAYARPGRARLLTARDRSVTSTFPELRALTGKAPQRGMILDGTVVALDDAGVPSRRLLMRRTATQRPGAALVADVPVGYFVSDLMWLDGEPTTALPYRRRRELIDDLGLAEQPVVLSPSWPASDADHVLETAGRYGLDGVYAKRLDSSYQPGRRSRNWLRVSLRRSRQVVVGGWTPAGPGRSDAVAALLLGVPGPDGLRYVGRVGLGSGPDRHAITSLIPDLRAGVQPFAGELPAGIADDAVWAVPRLVGRVDFSEWTLGGRLRLPVWRGLVEPDEVDDSLWDEAVPLDDPADRGRRADRSRGTASTARHVHRDLDDAGGPEPAVRHGHRSADPGVDVVDVVDVHPGAVPVVDGPVLDATDVTDIDGPAAVDRDAVDRVAVDAVSAERVTDEPVVEEPVVAEPAADDQVVVDDAGVDDGSVDDAGAADHVSGEHASAYCTTGDLATAPHLAAGHATAHIEVDHVAPGDVTPHGVTPDLLSPRGVIPDDIAADHAAPGRAAPEHSAKDRAAADRADADADAAPAQRHAAENRVADAAATAEGHAVADRVADATATAEGHAVANHVATATVDGAGAGAVHPYLDDPRPAVRAADLHRETSAGPGPSGAPAADDPAGVVRATAGAGGQPTSSALESLRPAAPGTAPERVLARRLEQHFVYNALNTIAALVRTDPVRARELLLGFADLTRVADQPAGASTTLAEELGSVRAYLQLEQARFGRRLHVTMEVDPALGEVEVTSMAVLAVVRAVVQQQIEPRPEGGDLRVTAAAYDGGCRVTVLDATTGYAQVLSFGAVAESAHG